MANKASMSSMFLQGYSVQAVVCAVVVHVACRSRPDAWIVRLSRLPVRVSSTGKAAPPTGSQPRPTSSQGSVRAIEFPGQRAAWVEPAQAPGGHGHAVNRVVMDGGQHALARSHGPL